MKLFFVLALFSSISALAQISYDGKSGPGKGTLSSTNERREKNATKARDAKNSKTDRKTPSKDPNLAKYYINRKTSPRPNKIQPIKTKLPLAGR